MSFAFIRGGAFNFSFLFLGDSEVQNLIQLPHR
jgi:hypothetical protein